MPRTTRRSKNRVAMRSCHANDVRHGARDRLPLRGGRAPQSVTHDPDGAGQPRTVSLTQTRVAGSAARRARTRRRMLGRPSRRPAPGHQRSHQRARQEPRERRRRRGHREGGAGGDDGEADGGRDVVGDRGEQQDANADGATVRMWKIVLGRTRSTGVDDYPARTSSRAGDAARISSSTGPM
jgi:hypothetical protein